MTEKKPSVLVAVTAAVIVAAAFGAIPLVTLWAVNVLFHAGLPYSFKTYGAMGALLLGAMLLRRGKT